MKAELVVHLGRDPYERKPQRNHRNGYRTRRITVKNLGRLELRIPRDRAGGFRSAVVPERIQYDPRIEQDLQMLFLGGASTRTVELMSERLFGRTLSSSEVSQANQKLLEPVERWRNRSLASEKYLYLFVDGTNFSMRRGSEVVKQCVLVVIGVTEDRRRQVLALQAGDKESKGAWEAVFHDLIRRDLDPSTIQLGIMDGLPGLEGAFLAAFRKATVQRCQVHKAKNVLVKVRKKDRKVVADDMRRDFEAITAYLAFPELEWMHLRTTNLIERLHKEFKRRTKPMEIVAGEESVYRILAFVAMKMEVSWRNAPFRNSGFRKLKPFAGYFTHES
jgi:putative transposase